MESVFGEAAGHVSGLRRARDTLLSAFCMSSTIRPDAPEERRSVGAEARSSTEIEGAEHTLATSGRRGSADRSPALIRNLDLATKVAREVSFLVPNSENAVDSGRVMVPTNERPGPGRHLERINGVLHKAYHTADGKKSKHQQDELLKGPVSWDDLAARAERLCTRSKMGNCGELAAMAFNRLKAHGAQSIEFVSISDGISDGIGDNPVIPHSFVVIGRDNASKIHTPSKYDGMLYSEKNHIHTPDTWGEEAVICDPWSRIAYPAKDHDKFWGTLREYCFEPNKLTCYLQYRWEKPS